MTKILVTGGAGFIPSCIAEKLAEKKENYIVVVDNFLTGHPSKIPASSHDNVKFIKGDVNNFQDISGVFYAYQFDYAHYACDYAHDYAYHVDHTYYGYV